MLGCIVSHRTGRSSRLGSLGRASLLVSLVLLPPLGCTEASKSPSSADAAPANELGRIAIELPVGISIGLGEQEPVPLPVEPIAVAPGSHTLVLASACQRVELAVDVAAGETLVVDRERAQGLSWATLQVTAKDRDAKPLLHAVELGDAVAGGGHGTSQVTVPACPYRMRVSFDGPDALGGVVEDIDFGRERAVTRAVVLAPGPDMVRLPGGRFTLGPPEALIKEWTDEAGYLIVGRYPVEVTAFEIDRSEVTAAQWMACRKAGGCVEKRELWYATLRPADRERPYCNVDAVELEAVLKEGRELHPMNCVARWEAEDYCRWAGKRLPTAIEWEYAARSGDDRTRWPWGNEAATCEHGRLHLGPDCREPGTVPVCSYPRGMSKQGVCDLVGNVEEYVDDEPETRPPTPPGEDPWESPRCMGTSWSAGDEPVFRESICGRRDNQTARAGFRCARTLARQ